MRSWRVTLAVAVTAIGVTACSSIDTHVEPPADWPELRVLEHRVPHHVMRERCSRFVPWYASPEACAEWHFARGECWTWYSADFPPAPWIVEHEQMHCRGFDHPGSTAARDAWHAFSATYAGRALAETMKRR